MLLFLTIVDTFAEAFWLIAVMLNVDNVVGDGVDDVQK